MTTLLKPATPVEPVLAPAGLTPASREGRHAKRGKGWVSRLPAGWPLFTLLVCYPLWWAIGLPVFIYALCAIPMAFHLYRRGHVRVPPGFGVWLVLIVFVAVSGLLLQEVPPDTLPTAGSGRYIGWAIRLVNYISLTVIMLYVLSLEEHELPRRRVVRMLGVMCVVTVIGGYVGMLAPDLSFSSPLGRILPGSIAHDPFVQRLTTVEVAQIQDVLEGESGQPRPSAPFEYTNTWGENMAILLIWMSASWVVLGKRMRRFAGVVIAALAIVPIVYSLNRGLWIGLGIAVVYVAIRLAVRGRFATLGGIAAGVGLFAVLLVATPLGTIITERAANGHSDDIRAKLNAAAVKSALTSPIAGYGGNRPLIGSGRSIAIGKSDDCKQCGNREIGSDGMLWHLLVGSGFTGALCYNLFFLWNLWTFRRDHSAIGIAASTVLVLVVFFQFLYGSLNSTLAYALISVAILARNDYHRRKQAMLRRLEAASP